MGQGQEPEQPGNDQGVGAVTTRRFPAPWSVRELEQAFVVVDANGQAVAYTINHPHNIGGGRALREPGH